LRGELRTKMLLHVLVQSRRGQIAEVAVPALAEDPRAARNLKQRADRFGERGIDDRRAHGRATLSAVAKGDAIPTHICMTFGEGCDAKCPRRFRMAIRADAKPAAVDQSDSNRTDPIRFEL